MAAPPLIIEEIGGTSGLMGRATARATPVIFENFPIALLGFGIALAGVIVGRLIYELCMCIYNGCRCMRGPKVRAPNGRGYVREARWACSGIWHLFALSFSTVIVVLGFYTGFFVAGLDLLNIAISLGVVGILVTYSFSGVLMNIAGAFSVAATSKVIVGHYIEIPSAGVQGEVHDVGWMMVNLEYIDDKGRRIEVHVPNNILVTSVVRRQLDYQPGAFRAPTFKPIKPIEDARSPAKRRQQYQQAIYRRFPMATTGPRY